MIRRGGESRRYAAAEARGDEEAGELVTARNVGLQLFNVVTVTKTRAGVEREGVAPVADLQPTEENAKLIDQRCVATSSRKFSRFLTRNCLCSP